MPATLTVRDETTSGQTLHSFPLEFPSERITIRDLVRERVYQEVQDYNRSEPEYFKGLVQPTDAEQTLNGYRIRQRRQIDWKAQFEMACQSFEQNGFFVLVNSHQAETLEEEVIIGRDTEVSFVRLTQLVGG
jgi:hypothetical protein